LNDITLVHDDAEPLGSSPPTSVMMSSVKPSAKYEP